MTLTVKTVPQQNYNGTITGQAGPVPALLVSAEVQVNCTTGNSAAPFTGFAKPFNSAAQSIEFGIKWSWDGGLTFPSYESDTVNGSPTGTWGADRHTGQPFMAPFLTFEDLPNDPALGGAPNWYQPFMTVTGGPITFGATITETTSA